MANEIASITYSKNKDQVAICEVEEERKPQLSDIENKLFEGYLLTYHGFRLMDWLNIMKRI